MKDLANFIYFAQRKSKVMRIYRRISIIRSQAMIKDLASQQNAVINMQQEWQNELVTSEKALTPLMEFSNRLVTAGPHDDQKVRKAVIADCLDNLNYFPAIQQLCQKIQDTEDLQFDQAFGNYSA